MLQSWKTSLSSVFCGAVTAAALFVTFSMVLSNLGPAYYSGSWSLVLDIGILLVPTACGGFVSGLMAKGHGVIHGFIAMSAVALLLVNRLDWRFLAYPSAVTRTLVMVIAGTLASWLGAKLNTGIRS